MSVIIKDMEMPKNCSQCEIWSKCWDERPFWFERLEFCPLMEMADRKTESDSEIPNNFDKDINVRSKTEPKLSEIPTSKCHYEPTDEPRPSKIIEAYAKGYKDGADAVKGIKDKQIRACDICKYEIGEMCTHPKVKTMKKEWATFEGDLWGEENTPKWCPIDKDEPQTERK